MNADELGLVIAGAHLAGFMEGVGEGLHEAHRARAKELVDQWNEARLKVWPHPAATGYVHHIDGNPRNNDPSNLMLTTEAAHGAGASASEAELRG